MSDRPWYPWYVGDARAKMRRLTLTQKGAYRELLDEVYATREPLPADLDQLCLIAGAMTDADRDAVRYVADKFFPINGDGLRHNNRAAEELALMGRRLENLSARGKKGAESRWQKKSPQTPLQPINHNPYPITQASIATGIPQALPEAMQQAQQSQPPSAARAKKPRDTAAAGKTVATWTAYATAYKARYGVEPVSNAKVNGMLGKLVDRVGGAEAPSIAAYYVQHRQSLYVRARHCVDLLLRDAEALRTEWATNTQVTATEAQMGDETAARGNVFTKLIKEIENGSR